MKNELHKRSEKLNRFVLFITCNHISNQILISNFSSEIETTYGRAHTTLASFWNKNWTSENLSLSFLFAPATKLYCSKKNCMNGSSTSLTLKSTQKGLSIVVCAKISLEARRIVGFGLCFYNLWYIWSKCTNNSKNDNVRSQDRFKQ